MSDKRGKNQRNNHMVNSNYHGHHCKEREIQDTKGKWNWECGLMVGGREEAGKASLRKWHVS